MVETSKKYFEYQTDFVVIDTDTMKLRVQQQYKQNQTE